MAMNYQMPTARVVVPVFNSDRTVTSYSRRQGHVVTRAGLFAITCVLAACATPATRIQTVEVKVPVAVQSIKPEQVPTVPAPLGPRPQSLSAAADVLLAKHCEWVAYALKADPLLKLAAKLKMQALPRFPECEGR